MYQRVITLFQNKTRQQEASLTTMVEKPVSVDEGLTLPAITEPFLAHAVN